MQWASVSDFLAMGGYAGYVWGSFGITAVVVAAEALQVRQRRRELLRDLHNELSTASDPGSCPTP